MFPLLETLIAVYETGRFTIAADELRVSQSTVSSRIAQLEQMVGSPLFERHAKSDVTPTQAGRLLYRTAIEICASWRGTRERIERERANRTPFLILCSHTTALVLLPRILEVLEPKLDEVDVRVQAMNSDAILERVGLKQAQLGIVEKPIINDSVDRTTLCEDRLVLAGDPNAVWLVREAGSGVRYYTDLYFKTSGMLPERSVEISSNAAIRACLSAGFGQSLISSAAVPQGVPVRALGAEFVRRFYAIAPRSGCSVDQRNLIDMVIARLTETATE